MPGKTPVYEELNKKWKAACRILLAGEIGDLEDYAEWLYERNGPRTAYKPSKSGKTVVSYDGRYSKNAKWLSLDEVNFSEKKPPPNINQIKDIDSVLQGISEKIQRCFEVSETRSSADCYYCHNVENCHDCMFCFNAKNLKYAVGNVEIPKEKYLEIKKKILAQLNDELSRTNSISLSIFNLPDVAASLKKK